MATTLVYSILLLVASIILIIPWLLTWRQMCFVSDTNNKERFHRTIYVLILISFLLTLHTFVYMLAIHGNVVYKAGINLFRITYIIEAITIIYGFHISRKLSFAFVDRLYLNAMQERPKSITCGLYLSEVTIIFSAFICYFFGLLFFDDITFVYIFYIIFNIILLYAAISFSFVVRTLQNMLAHVAISDVNEIQIRSSLRAVKSLQTMLIIMIIGVLFHIFFDIQSLHNFLEWKFDPEFVQCILHSVYCAILAYIFMSMVMEKNKDLCFVHKQSVCWAFVENNCNSGRRRKTIEIHGAHVILLSDTSNKTMHNNETMMEN